MEGGTTNEPSPHLPFPPDNDLCPLHLSPHTTMLWDVCLQFGLEFSPALRRRPLHLVTRCSHHVRRPTTTASSSHTMQWHGLFRRYVIRGLSGEKFSPYIYLISDLLLAVPSFAPFASYTSSGTRLKRKAACSLFV